MAKSSNKNESKIDKLVRVGFYELERTIGRGNFAVVKSATNSITKSKVIFSSLHRHQLYTYNLFLLFLLPFYNNNNKNDDDSSNSNNNERQCMHIKKKKKMCMLHVVLILFILLLT